MNAHPADRPLDAEMVAQLVGDQFPELGIATAEYKDEGWDNEVYTYGDDWVFRFPKRAEVVPWFGREIEIMRVVEQTRVPAPRFEKIGSRSPTFPYPFVGYRPVRGVAADECERPDLDGLAANIGEAWTSLHAIDIGLIPPTPGGGGSPSWEAWRAAYLDNIDLARELVPVSIRAAAEPFLRAEIPPPPFGGPERFNHSDICPEHIIVDDATGHLAGIIDFADARVGDPVGDFVGLVSLGGYGFVERVLDHYSMPLDVTFRERLRWSARTLHLHWLADAIDEGVATEGGKHQSWVERAFEE